MKGLRVSSWARHSPKPSVATLDMSRSYITSKVTALMRIPCSGEPIPVRISS